MPRSKRPKSRRRAHSRARSPHRYRSSLLRSLTKEVPLFPNLKALGWHEPVGSPEADPPWKYFVNKFVADFKKRLNDIPDTGTQVKGPIHAKNHLYYWYDKKDKNVNLWVGLDDKTYLEHHKIKLA